MIILAMSVVVLESTCCYQQCSCCGRQQRGVATSPATTAFARSANNCDQSCSNCVLVGVGGYRREQWCSVEQSCGRQQSGVAVAASPREGREAERQGLERRWCTDSRTALNSVGGKLSPVPIFVALTGGFVYILPFPFICLSCVTTMNICVLQHRTSINEKIYTVR